MNHAAWVTSERSTKKVEANREGSAKKKQKDEDDPIVFLGKRLGELNSEQLAAYYGGGMFGGD